MWLTVIVRTHTQTHKHTNIMYSISFFVNGTMAPFIRDSDSKNTIIFDCCCCWCWCAIGGFMPLLCGVKKTLGIWKRVTSKYFISNFHFKMLVLFYFWYSLRPAHAIDNNNNHISSVCVCGFELFTSNMYFGGSFWYFTDFYSLLKAIWQCWSVFVIQSLHVKCVLSQFELVAFLLGRAFAWHILNVSNAHNGIDDFCDCRL